MTITLDALLAMSNDALFDIVRAAHPLDLEALANTSYTGIDLSMPAFFHKLFWKSFRKTFHLDPATGVLRGWNVKVQQTGWESPPEPKRGRDGRPLSFGHYEVRSARGLKFPRGWTGEHYLDYRFAGNPFYEFPAGNGYCPLVSVNAGDSELLLGWEIFKVGPLAIPIRDFWVLKREGPLAPADVLPRPDAKRPALPS
ncbi:MAG: hypothetical protein R3F39_10295 [Myxococcota bacterium]